MNIVAKVVSVPHTDPTDIADSVMVPYKKAENLYVNLYETSATFIKVKTMLLKFATLKHGFQH